MISPNKKVQFFLIHLEIDQFEPFFIELLSSGVALEILDPRELGSKWQNVSFLETSNQERSNLDKTAILKQLDQTINTYLPSFAFEEKYETGDVNKILENWQEKYLFDAVQRLNSNSIINKKFLQQKSILKKVKNKWEVTILKDLKALYTKYEIASKLPLIYQKLFKIDNNSEVAFACFAIIKADTIKTIDILKQHKIDYELTSWTKQIVIFGVNKDLTFGISSDGLDLRLAKFIIYIYYFLCAFVIHDIFVGLIILITISCVYRLELRNKVFLSQIWTGLGALIFGIIGGSFAGNFLQVLSISKYLVVKESSGGILGFLSLFQIVDWTNQNQNLILNNNLAAHNISPVAIFTIIFIFISFIIIIITQVIKVANDYRNNLIRQSIVRSIFITTITIWISTLLRFTPPWLALIATFVLIIYQPDLQIITKIKTFFIGEFGVFGLIKLLIRSLLFGAVFGTLICCSLFFNFINNSIGDNVIILFILNTIVSIILWQVTAFVVAKALKVNLVDQVTENISTSQPRTFNPLSKFKYWKF